MKNVNVAALVTEYFRPAHADVVVAKILEGYDLDRRHTEPRIGVASMYLEQVGEYDIGVGLAQKHGVPLFGSIGEALAVGGTGGGGGAGRGAALIRGAGWRQGAVGRGDPLPGRLLAASPAGDHEGRDPSERAQYPLRGHQLGG